jgi:hypothetical protein
VSDDDLADLDDDLESLYVRRVLSQNAADIDRVLTRIQHHVARWQTHDSPGDPLAGVSARDLYELAAIRQAAENAAEQRRLERLAWAMDAPALGAYRHR